MPFTKVNDLLGKSLKQAGIKRQVSEAKLIENFFELTKNIISFEMRHKLKPLYVKDGSLQIACLSTVLVERLKSRENEIIEALNKPYGRRIINRLKFLA